MRDLIGITYDGVSGGPELTAAEWRQSQAALFVRGTTDLVIGGVRGGAVSNSGFSVTIAPLTSVAHPSAARGVYMGAFPAGSAELSQTINAAHATLPRVDAIDVKFYDHEADGSGKRGIDIEYNPGTAASSPSAPTFTGVGWRLGTFAVPASGGGNPAFTPNASLLAYAAAGGAVLPPNIHARTVAGSANFVKPTNPAARFHYVRIWGGGGAGGGTDGQASGTAEGGGGGGGGYVEKWYQDSDLAASEPYTVGAGGAGVNFSNGNAGGNTTFKGLTAGGGGGGLAMASTAASQGALRGAGGSASGGDLNSPGGDGGSGRTINGVACFTNYGGASPSGGGLTQQTDFVASNGTAGSSPGGGGSGSFSSTADFAGGSGADGKILIVSVF